MNRCTEQAHSRSTSMESEKQSSLPHCPSVAGALTVFALCVSQRQSTHYKHVHINKCNIHNSDIYQNQVTFSPTSKLVIYFLFL